MSSVFSNMITTSTEDLVDSGAIESFDVLLCGGNEIFHELQAEIERDPSYVVLSLDAEDLQDKEVLVREIYRLICNEDADEESSIVENIEIIEEELAGTQSCILCLEDFFGCSEEAQAILLELVIVSQFKLLIGIKALPSELENEKLWKVLQRRASWVSVSLANSITEEDILDNEEDYPSLGIQNVEEDDFAVEDEIESFEEHDEDLSAYVRPESKNRQQKQWYQMIPKYHLGVALILLLLVFALWNMDLTKTKEKSIDLNAETPASLDVRKQDETSEENQEQENKIALPTETEVEIPIEKNIVKEGAVTDKKIEQESEIVVTQIPKTSPVVEPIVEVVEPVVKKPVEKVIAPVKNTPVDWSPYQSNAFIKGVNSRYYTLQLLASHNEQGIRDFLKEKGSSSNYAVYTTQKDGKPWHVIIYGVYETHDSANSAREDLPAYLKSYSPWIRTIADVQKSL